MSDLRQFMQETGRDNQPKLEPLPPIQTAESFVYNADGLTDPFKPSSVKSDQGGGVRPDFDRPKEPLEQFALDGLRMVGTLERAGQRYALVRTPENTVFRVKKGDRIGENFGVITNISEAGIDIKETIQDSAGDWTESTASLPLIE